MLEDRFLLSEHLWEGQGRWSGRLGSIATAQLVLRTQLRWSLHSKYSAAALRCLPDRGHTPRVTTGGLGGSFV